MSNYPIPPGAGGGYLRGGGDSLTVMSGGESLLSGVGDGAGLDGVVRHRPSPAWTLRRAGIGGSEHVRQLGG